VCAALELAARGQVVDLYEQGAQLIGRASYWNEGKIHLGLVYAQDRSRRTARAMLEGALRFRPVLARWIETDILDRAVSGPFVYAVNRRTQAPPSAVEAHFRAVADLYRSLGRQQDAGYVVPLEGWIWRPIDGDPIFDRDEIAASYLTEERSIDPFIVAAGLRSAAFASPNLTVLTNSIVKSVTRGRGTELCVASDRGGYQSREVYGAVVNALWQNRLGIDASFGLTEGRPLLHRFKIGLHSEPSFVARDLPTVTFVLGPFGDTVNFGHRAYLCWYPAGHIYTSKERTPTMTDDQLLGRDLSDVEAETLDAIGRLIPTLRADLRQSAGHWRIGGGYITAWGKTDIDDERSQLHQRYQIGFHSAGTYHSIDTGKYTMGPHFADLVCDRIASRKVVVPSAASRGMKPGELQ
jgi:glycine/D-amino acid oxidase-like deaminating enzyme